MWVSIFATNSSSNKQRPATYLLHLSWRRAFSFTSEHVQKGIRTRELPRRAEFSLRFRRRMFSEDDDGCDWDGQKTHATRSWFDFPRVSQPVVRGPLGGQGDFSGGFISTQTIGETFSNQFDFDRYLWTMFAKFLTDIWQGSWIFSGYIFNKLYQRLFTGA